MRNKSYQNEDTRFSSSEQGKRAISLCQTCKKGILLAFGHWPKNKEPPSQVGIVA